MNNHATTRNVLWADDDAGDTLQSIARLLQKRGKLSLVIAEDYQQAVERLNGIAIAGPNDRFTALIVDTILPPGIRDAALGNYLGIKLAQLAAATHGIGAIVFLSVVPYGEVAHHFARLETDHPTVSFAYFNKLVLFDGTHFDDLLGSLARRRT